MTPLNIIQCVVWVNNDLCILLFKNTLFSQTRRTHVVCTRATMPSCRGRIWFPCARKTVSSWKQHMLLVREEHPVFIKREHSFLAQAEDPAAVRDNMCSCTGQGSCSCTRGRVTLLAQQHNVILAQREYGPPAQTK